MEAVNREAKLSKIVTYCTGKRTWNCMTAECNCQGYIHHKNENTVHLAPAPGIDSCGNDNRRKKSCFENQCNRLKASAKGESLEPRCQIVQAYPCKKPGKRPKIC